MLAFLDIDYLDVSESVKDELRLASLHGLNLAPFVQRFANDHERLHCIRVLLQGKSFADGNPLLTTLPNRVLECLITYQEQNNPSLMHQVVAWIATNYVDDTHHLVVSETVMAKLLHAGLIHHAIFDYDLTIADDDTVDSFIYGVTHHIDLTPIVHYATSHHVPQMVALLISLSASHQDIRPFLEGEWTEPQLYALFSAPTVIKADQLLTDYHLTDTFTRGMIIEIIRGYQILPNLATLLSTTDGNGVPIYNQYQMYEIVEGMRLHIDVSSYCDPSISDLDMRLKRESLLQMKESRQGYPFKERLLSKTNVQLNDDFITQLVEENNTTSDQSGVLFD